MEEGSTSAKSAAICSHTWVTTELVSGLSEGVGTGVASGLAWGF